MEEISKILIVAVWITAGVLLFTPYEAVLETILALLLIAAVIAGFLLHPRKDVFYVRTTVRLSDADQNQTLEHDLLAVKIELMRLWLLFVPTFLALAFLVVSAADGILWNLSFLNKIFSTKYAFVALYCSHWMPLIVLILLWTWIRERWVIRDAEACSATSFSVNGRRVSYTFRGERGEYCGGDCVYVGLVKPLQLATIVFYNDRKPELNKIAMGLLFHRLTIFGRGVTDLDKQTLAAQTALAETSSCS
jgi:hypothetical protein